jgi:hypothetical protein
MVKRFIPFLLLITALTLFANPGLPLMGNIGRPLMLTSEGALDGLLDAAAPQTEAALLIASDGTAVRVYRNAFPRLRLACENNEWNAYGDSLPPVCDLRNLAGIALDRANRTFTLHLINGSEETGTITPYAAVLRQFELIGISQRSGCTAMKYHRIRDAFSTPADSSLALCIGRPEHFPGKCDISLNRYYFTAEGDTVVGLWKHPPAESVFSLHAMLSGLMEEGPLLVLFVDSYGLRLHQDLTALKADYALKGLSPLRAAYPSKTASSYWAFGTGTSYWLRNHRGAILEDILKPGDNAVLVEDDHPYYQAPVPVLAMTDLDKDGSIDDEIFQQAVQEMDKHHDFMLVHFHSIDDAGHEFGPYSQQRLEHVRQVSGYVNELASKWKGPVLVFSDHGMHDDGRRGGTHGSALAEDMLAMWGRIK